MLTASQLPTALEGILAVGHVPYVHGSPGIGKSSIMQQLADKYKLFLIDIRLSQRESVDILGFPTIKKNKMGYLPMEDLPLLGDPIPEGYTGFLLFLDEFNAASRSVQAASYQLVLDRIIGSVPLHPECHITAAGNNITDNSITNDLSTAMQSRLIHLELISDHESWLKWANANRIDQRVISFIKFRPDMLNKFDPDHNDKTFPCERTWEFLSDYIAKIKDFNVIHSAVMQGTVSTGPAIEFKTFCELYSQLPTKEQIEQDPEGFPIKDEPSHHYALTTLIAHSVNGANISRMIRAVNRLPEDMQVVCIRDMIQAKKVTTSTPEIQPWIENHADLLF